MRISDWSSDVCSSDLTRHGRHRGRAGERRPSLSRPLVERHPGLSAQALVARSGARIVDDGPGDAFGAETRSEEHTSELQSLMRISYAVFCLKKKNKHNNNHPNRRM